MTAAPNASTLKPGEVFDDRYQVLGLLGRGGMAEVLHCRDLQTEQRVAVKLLALNFRASEDHRLRLRREAEIAAAVAHPNVVQILNIGQTPLGDPYLVMELLLGETLRDFIDREGAMQADRALPFIREAAAGLAAMHAKGIIHRDVKPNNLFLCGPTGQPLTMKVFDFGFARVQSRKRSQGQVLGTLEYMAPEQVVSDPTDARADIYSLGVVMYLALTNELPFDLASAKDLLAHQLISAAPPPSWLIPDFDPRLEKVILGCIRKHPDNRYATMDAVLSDIDSLLAGGPVVGAPVVKEPDVYEPQSDLGQRALRMLQRRQEPDYNSTAPPPVARPNANGDN